MSYAEDGSVPDAAAGNEVAEDPYDLHGDPFGMGMGTHTGLLTRSVSRKRLSPEALAVGANAAQPEDCNLASGPVDDPALSALLLGYQSCPGVVPHSDAFRIPRRMRAGRVGAAAVTRVGVALRGAGAGQPNLRPSPEPETQPHEVPVLKAVPADATVSATTAASVFATSATSAGHVPSAPLPPWRPYIKKQPYSDLLSGPGFSYAADDDGVFEADAISLGSLGSGSPLGSAGFMMDSDYEDEDEDDIAEFRPSPGTLCSGSGERFDAAAAAKAATPAADEDGPAATVAAAAPASQLDDAPAVAAVVRSSGGTDAAVAAVDGGEAVRMELHPEVEVEEDEEGLDIGLPARSRSIESVGSADMDDLRAPSCNSRAAQDGAAAATAAAGPGLPPPAACIGVSAAAGDVIAFQVANFHLQTAAAAAAPFLPGAPLPPPVAVALGAPAPMLGVVGGEAIGGWASGSAPQPQHPAGLMMGQGSVAAASAAATLPLAAATTASPLLPPEVYLGFVTQLVESVRTAARAVDEACQAERQSGFGFAGRYGAQFAAAPGSGGAAGGGAM
ncbi:hypothetical protein PLESTB_000330700 [Pleodorina starrii]|uniref:Uncharacterized protein n=1 Tax=Pleodorina starrii TaxID=330485 RepID=A0A9W6EYG9_9CHLO|nr:hypothetical protein PLESTB_000330700 [Pleodorina starrii]GLC75123.1 hypothetical protein PLESTF_001596300 [Pleodorina starrii]